MKNVADFWNDHPFMVINSDIFTDIDLKKVYDFHLNHGHPVTLVLHDDPQFNTVPVNKRRVLLQSSMIPHPCPLTLVSGSNMLSAWKKPKNFTFTGIQVLDPQVLELIPDNIFSSSIDIYRQLISEK